MSVELSEKIFEIGKKYNLHIDQIGQLKSELMHVVVGLKRRNDFTANLGRALGVSGDQANLIVYDLNKEVFLPLREIILDAGKERVNQNKENDEGNEEEPTNTPTVNNLEETETISKGLLANRLSGPFNVPKEKVEVNDETGDNEGTPAIVTKDPYREPLE